MNNSDISPASSFGTANFFHCPLSKDTEFERGSKSIFTSLDKNRQKPIKIENAYIEKGWHKFVKQPL